MDLYLCIKTLHILSSAILFGTGVGIAFFMLRSCFANDGREKFFAARNTVLADGLFTLPTVIIQPLTGLWLVSQGGYGWTDLWLAATYVLYAVAVLFWLPVVEGTLDVFHAGPVRAFSWIFAFLGSIPPYTETNVPVTVHFRSDPDTNRVHFHRVFHFRGRKPYHFRSYMIQSSGGDVMEVTRMGMVWRIRYAWENGRVVMKHGGYGLRLAGIVVPLPLHLLIGEAYAEEIPVDDNSFDMHLYLTHRKWGRIYSYKGRFRLMEMEQTCANGS